MNRFKTIFFAILSAFYSCAVLSQDLVVSTEVGIDVFNDDQFDLQTQNSETSAIVYRPGLAIGYAGQQYQNTLEFGAIYNEFFDSEFNSTTNFNARWQTQRNSATSNLSVYAGFEQRLVEDFLEFDDVNATATQIVETVNAGSTYTVDFSALNQVQVSYSYTETQPADNPLLDTVENVRHDFSAQWLRTQSTRSNFGVSANIQSYRPESSDAGGAAQRADIDTLGFAFVGAYQLTDRWNLAGNIGANQAQIDDDVDLIPDENVVVEDGDVLLIASIGATYTGRRNVVALNMDAGTTQQLDGVVDNQQSISLNWTRSISERWNSNVSSRYFTAERDDRTNINLQASLSWQQSARLLYRFSYQHRAQEFDIGDDVIGASNQSNRFTISLAYSFEDINIRL